MHIALSICIFVVAVRVGFGMNGLSIKLKLRSLFLSKVQEFIDLHDHIDYFVLWD